MDISFFAGVDLDLLKQADPIFKNYVKGITVHAHGDNCIGIDIVLSGSLVAYSLSQNGSENIVSEFHVNSTIGANLLFSNANQYPMNIYCTEDCELMHLKKCDVEFLLHDYQFTMNFIKSISLNSQKINKKIAIYKQRSLRENLLEYFNALSAEQNSKTVTLPISKKQLADYLGVQRPSLFRELKKMKEEDLIKIENHQIYIFYNTNIK